MMNDSVREELQTKIGASMPVKTKIKEPRPVLAAPQRVELPPIPKPAQSKRAATAELAVQHTNPTLVDFQAKNSVLPDWRLQLQNTVRQRKETPASNLHVDETASPIVQKRLVTRGANALKTEGDENTGPEPQIQHSNPRVANALKRIADSRKTFLAQDSAPESQKSNAPAAPRNYPFNVVSRNAAPTPPSAPDVKAKASVNAPPKPKLVTALRIEKKDYDTNKLPPIAQVEKRREIPQENKFVKEQTFVPIPEIRAIEDENLIHIADAEPVKFDFPEAEEIDDLAPVSMRFNAGLFDVIIGSFASFILLSPVVFMGGEWFSAAGILAFVATCAIVLFIYLTIAIGMYGKTVGMRMFSLELVDAEENDYPTFHQAAVSSAVYLLLLPLLGAGFIPLLLNEEQRATHDLVSGTIVVTEF